MKKIRLDPESLEVQSFSTDALRNPRGTVQGAQVYEPWVPRTQGPECQVESGRCIGTRYDYTCDTSWCIILDTVAADCVPMQMC